MLTIKHIETKDESVRTATCVSYDCDKVILTAFGCADRTGAVDEYGTCRYSSGRIYVMNDHGATVATYDLD